jgi:NAD(P)-dependent dehydrogenase (short-subunit alcohol dehydrogenase family)
MPVAIDVTGKIAIVTMSTSGIGLAIAVRLAAAGARAVILNGRDEDRGRRACAALRAVAPGVEATFIAADILDREQLGRLFDAADDRYGGLDYYVGIGTVQSVLDPFVAIDPDRYVSVMQGLALHFMEGCRFALPLMKQRGGGAIVSIQSDAGRIPTPGEAVIGAALAAAGMFVRTLALEAARDRIRVNAILPSLVLDTGQFDVVMETDFSRKIFEKISRKALLGLPAAEDVANLALFLLSPMAACITGQAISINGGVSVA